MKNLSSILIAMLLTGIVNAQSVYPGNGKTGYGGPVGTGSLQISDDGSTISFRFLKGSNDLNDAVVIYLNTVPDGFNTTANFTDVDDGLRRAISGYKNPDRATLNFPEKFLADYAIAFDAGTDAGSPGFGGLWQLVENGSHNYIGAVNLTPEFPRSAAEFDFSVAKSDIGITSDKIGFQFLVTYASETGYRSNEFIGDNGPVDDPQNSSYTATTFLTYSTVLPIGFANINAQYNSQGVRINWTSTDVETGSQFNIERASDGTHFQSIGAMPGNSSGSYSYMDNNPLNGINYYRIAYINPLGKKSYSKTVTTQVMSRDAVKAYYNGSVLKFSLELNTKGNYKLALINASGQILLVKPISYDGTVNTFDLNPESNLSYGIYSLILKGEGASFSTQILVK